MNSSLVKVLVVVVVAVVLLGVLRYFGLGNVSMEGMTNMSTSEMDRQVGVDATAGSGTMQSESNEGYSGQQVMGADNQSVMSAGAEPGVQMLRSQNCFPKEQLTPGELLPQDNSSVWAQVNPQGSGTLKDRNFLQAGHHVGVNTVGQTLRNANLQLRSEPPNPQVKVSPWLQSTIDPDTNRKPFELGGCA